MQLIRNTLNGAGMVALAIGLASSAHAQTAATDPTVVPTAPDTTTTDPTVVPTAPDTTAPSQPATATSQAAPFEPQEIVVTANKREEKLNRVGLSVDRKSVV